MVNVTIVITYLIIVNSLCRIAHMQNTLSINYNFQIVENKISSQSNWLKNGI